MKWISFVEMKNFKLHRDKRVDFDRHMNIITGESDAGKSTILKAIIKCLYNKPDRKGESFLSWNSQRGDKVEIRVGIRDDDEGRLTPDKSPETIIERVMGKSNVNEYNIYYPNGEVSNYSGFGKKVPPEVISVHGMREVDMGYGKEQLNYLGQFEGFFLIGKRPEDVATAIGRLAQTEVIDKVKDGLRSDIAVNSRNINKTNEDIKEVTENIKSYSYIEDYEKKLSYMNDLKDDMEVNENMISKSTDLSRKIKTTASEMKDVSGILKQRIDFNKYEKEIDDSMDNLRKLNAINDVVSKPINKASENILRVSNTINRFPDLTLYKQNLDDIKGRAEIVSKSTEISRKIKNSAGDLEEVYKITRQGIDFDKTDSGIEKIKENIRQEDNVGSMMLRIEGLAMNLAEDYIKSKELKDSLEDTRKELKESMGDRCPVCGSDISGKDIDEMKTHLAEI